MLKKAFFWSVISVLLLLTVFIAIVGITYPYSFGLLMDIEEKYLSTSNITKNYYSYRYDGMSYIRHNDKTIIGPHIVKHYEEKEYIYILKNEAFIKDGFGSRYEEDGFGCQFYKINHVTDKIIGPIDINQVQFSNDKEKDIFLKSKAIFANDIKNECPNIK